MINERTLVIFKPDVLQRQISGEILTRFERKGFKIAAMKMILPSEELVGEHYEGEIKYLTGVGEKSIDAAKKRNEDTSKMDAFEIGSQIRKWNLSYLSCGPVLAIVFKGPHIINSVRKMIGSTNPQSADVGTIRADYSPDSYLFADTQGRTTRTVLHASDSVESAEREIPLWFNENEIFDYEVGIEKILYDKGWTESK